MPARRNRLAAIVTQAWLIGSGGGTLVVAVALALIPGTGLVGLGFLLVFAVFFAVIAAAIPYLIGLAIVLIAPAWALRHRAPLCLALPVLTVFGLLAVTAGVASASLWMTAMGGVDATIAALWCWRGARKLVAADPRDLTSVFD